jgi:protein-tyrosine phosphatase
MPPGHAGRRLILFVCLANVCRSPVMAFLTAHRLEEQGLGSSFVAECAGTKAIDGDRMCAVAAAHVELYPSGAEFVKSHRARTVSRELVDAAGLILVASSRERAAVAGPWQEARPKTFTMVEAAQLAQAVAEGSTSSQFARRPMTLEALGAAMGDLRGSLRQGNVGTPRRALLSRRRQRSLDVPDVHQGEVRTHAPVIESLERASSHLVHAIGRLAEMNPGPNVGDYS